MTKIKQRVPESYIKKQFVFTTICKSFNWLNLPHHESKQYNINMEKNQWGFPTQNEEAMIFLCLIKWYSFGFIFCSFSGIGD